MAVRLGNAVNFFFELAVDVNLFNQQPNIRQPTLYSSARLKFPPPPYSKYSEIFFLKALLKVAVLVVCRRLRAGH